MAKSKNKNRIQRQADGTGAPRSRGETTNHSEPSCSSRCINTSIASSIISRVAILGDSGLALFGSFALLVVAVAVSLWMDQIAQVDEGSSVHPAKADQEAAHWEKRYQDLGPIPHPDPPHIFNVDDENAFDEIRAAYRKDGVVAVRGLISQELLERLDRESQILTQKESSKTSYKKKKHKKPTQFHTMVQNAIFRAPPMLNITSTTDEAFFQTMTTTALLEVAILSRVPAMAAELLKPELTEHDSSVRLLRDIFLAKDDEAFICGFHIDDWGFWPATAAAPGINAWVALDDMPAEGGGGFALAVGSHAASWKDEAHYVTGATTTYPINGFYSVEDMFANRTGSGTCNIKTSAPHLHRRMEETKRIYDMQRGDVIFHQRWLFHRTVPFDRALVAEEASGGDLLYRRYSLRYGPGSAVIPPGYGTEPSVLWNEQNGNRTADQVAELDESPWYPKVWPVPSRKEFEGLQDLIENKIPIAGERRAARLKEMQPFLKNAASKQSSNNKH